MGHHCYPKKWTNDLHVYLSVIYCPTREYLAHLETSPLGVKAKARHLRPLSMKGSLSCHNCCNMRHQLWRSYPKDHNTFVALYDNKGVLRTYSKPNPYRINSYVTKPINKRYYSMQEWKIFFPVIECYTVRQSPIKWMGRKTLSACSQARQFKFFTDTLFTATSTF